MNFRETIELINQELGNNILVSIEQENSLMPIAVVNGEHLLKLANFLYSHQLCYYDYLSCITGIDNGVEKATMEVVYNLYSIPFDSKFCFKVVLDRNTESNSLPKIESLSHIWRTANWHEREIFDLLGIEFLHHPDLRRILLPADWEGFPLRKDYNLQEYYHGIKVEY